MTAEEQSAFLVGLSEIAGALIGTWLVGLFFYLELDSRRTEFKAASHGYLRAGARGVFIQYSIPLFVSLAFLALEPIWGRLLFAALGLVLLVTTANTIRLTLTRRSSTQSFGIRANEWTTSAAVVVLVALPWVLGGLTPRPEDFFPSLLIALGAGFASTVTMVMAEFDTKREANR